MNNPIAPTDTRLEIKRLLPRTSTHRGRSYNTEAEKFRRIGKAASALLVALSIIASYCSLKMVYTQDKRDWIHLTGTAGLVIMTCYGMITMVSDLPKKRNHNA